MGFLSLLLPKKQMQHIHLKNHLRYVKNSLGREHNLMLAVYKLCCFVY
jgi:hypothetical protein